MSTCLLLLELCLVVKKNTMQKLQKSKLTLSFEIEMLQKVSPGGNVTQPLPSYFWCVSK